MLARILTPPASKRCQAQADQHMAAEAETLQKRRDMKEQIRVPIEKGAFISAPSSFCSMKCQGTTLLTSYLPNNDHNQNSSFLWWPLWPGWIALPGTQRRPSQQQKAQHTKLLPHGSVEALQFTVIREKHCATSKMFIYNILKAKQKFELVLCSLWQDMF